jgi:methylenetetrahydrofolate reductase (NADPH)
MSFARKLSDGGFAVLAEVEPPKGTDVSSFVAVSVRVKDRVDAVMVPEMTNAVMKMGSLGGCILLQQKGVATVMQMTCRDRNRLALQADLLAAGALGV